MWPDVPQLKTLTKNKQEDNDTEIFIILVQIVIYNVLFALQTAQIRPYAVAAVLRNITFNQVKENGKFYKVIDLNLW